MSSQSGFLASANNVTIRITVKLEEPNTGNILNKRIDFQSENLKSLQAFKDKIIKDKNISYDFTIVYNPEITAATPKVKESKKGSGAAVEPKEKGDIEVDESNFQNFINWVVQKKFSASTFESSTFTVGDSSVQTPSIGAPEGFVKIRLVRIPGTPLEKSKSGASKVGVVSSKPSDESEAAKVLSEVLNDDLIKTFLLRKLNSDMVWNRIYKKDTVSLETHSDFGERVQNIFREAILNNK